MSKFIEYLERAIKEYNEQEQYILTCEIHGDVVRIISNKPGDKPKDFTKEQFIKDHKAMYDIIQKNGGWEKFAQDKAPVDFAINSKGQVELVDKTEGGATTPTAAMPKHERDIKMQATKNLQAQKERTFTGQAPVSGK